MTIERHGGPDGDPALGDEVDLFVIGAGSGGVRAARIAAEAGARVAIAEEYRVGGTCVIRGCVPKKLMAHAALFAEDFDDAVGFGWRLDNPPRFSWEALRDALQAEVTRLSGLYVDTLRRAGVHIVHERARLADVHTVELTGSGRRIRAGTILIATGGTPVRPHGMPGGELGITSNEIFHLPQQPRRLVVVGAGYIAVEFASILRMLGSEVTLVYRRDLILRGFDIDLRRGLQQALSGRGVAFRLEDDVTALARRDDGAIDAQLASGASLTADAVLFAIGRRPNTADLGLEQVGVECAADGAIVVDDYSRTSVPSVWAVGDVTNRINLTPVAIREGHAFALTCFHGRPTRVDHGDVPSAVFSLPPLATVGLGEDDALEQLGEVDVYTRRFRPLRHTLAGRDERSLVKAVVDPQTDRVLGLHMLGPDAPEIIQGLAVAMKMGLRKTDLDRTTALHPSSAEEFVLLRDAERRRA